jgi:thiamine pyrophosphokinase
MHASSSHLALLLAGGELVVTPRALERVRDAALVVAADGGARHAAALGLTVDVWVGDFDSSDGLTLNAPRQTHPTEKDQTDLELALMTAKARGATEALVLGAFGGRFDHALGIALMAARETAQGFTVNLESGTESGWVLTPQCPLELALTAGQTFSALALEGDAHGLSIRGARWDLDRATLGFGSSLGISNVAKGMVTLSLERGVVLVVAQWDER